MVFVEAPETIDQIKTIAKEIPQWKLLNMFQGEKHRVWHYPNCNRWVIN